MAALPGDLAARRRRAVFGLTWIAYASLYFTRKDFAVAKGDMESQLRLDPTRLGDIDTAFQAAYCAGQFLWGLVADRVGSRRVIGFGMLASAACAMAFAGSSTFAALLLFWGLNGLMQSTGWPANIKAMGQWFAGERRGAVMGFWSTCYQLGSLAANPLAAFFLLRFTWRGAFLGPAAIVAAVGVVVLLALPSRERSPGGPAPRSRAEIRAERARVLATPEVWALGSAYFFLKLIRYVLLLWLPYYMGKAVAGLHYGPTAAASVPLAFEAGGFLGSVAIGAASERWFGGGRLGVSILALTALAGALPLFAWAAPLGVGANLASLALVGFFLFGPDTLLSGAAAQDLGGVAAGATAAGLINGMGSLGPIVQGRLTSWMSQSYGWQVLFSSLGVGAVLSAAILAPFWWRARSRARIMATEI